MTTSRLSVRLPPGVWCRCPCRPMSSLFRRKRGTQPHVVNRRDRRPGRTTGGVSWMRWTAGGRAGRPRRDPLRQPLLGSLRRRQRRWRDHARHGLPGGLRRGGGRGSAAADVAAGLRDVLTGNRERFTCQYPCHGRGQERYFELRASRYVHERRHRRASAAPRRDRARDRRARAAPDQRHARPSQRCGHRHRSRRAHRVLEPGGRKIYGWSAEEAYGRDLARLTVAPELSDAREEIMAALMRDGRLGGRVRHGAQGRQHVRRRHAQRGVPR